LAADDVAAAFSQAIELFARTKPHHVKHVKIVVYEKTLVDLFQNNIVQAKGNDQYHEPKWRLYFFLQSPLMAVKVAGGRGAAAQD